LEQQVALPAQLEPSGRQESDVEVGVVVGVAVDEAVAVGPPGVDVGAVVGVAVDVGVGPPGVEVGDTVGVAEGVAVGTAPSPASSAAPIQ